jgi:hypothetical protein
MMANTLSEPEGRIKPVVDANPTPGAVYGDAARDGGRLIIVMLRLLTRRSPRGRS